ncbi:MAG: RNA methyltransferase [Coriobacteriia bacterium]|nr:RNA methyltransferase [Coriobacteriia bacterium]
MEKLQPIRSKDNDLYKKIKSYTVPKYRKRDNVVLVEGQKTYDEAYTRLNCLYTIVSESYYLKNAEVGAEAAEGVQHVIDDALFSSLSELKTSQGILGVFQMPDFHIDLATLQRVVVLQGVQDPKNVGAIMRNAHCLGYQAVFLSEGCAQVFSPKAIRAAMGASLYVPSTVGDIFDQVIQLKEAGFTVIAADLSGSETLPADLTSQDKIALLIGGEGSGISPEVLQGCDYRFRIPLQPGAESLNVSVASGIVMYLLNTPCNNDQTNE